MNNLKQRQIFTGVVIRKKAKKTISVLVENKKLNKKYNIYHRVHKKYQVHDEKEAANLNDKVLIMQTRPFSATKKFCLLKIL
jgi:small subunit ribosomal protein S17